MQRQRVSLPSLGYFECLDDTVLEVYPSKLTPSIVDIASENAKRRGEMLNTGVNALGYRLEESLQNQIYSFLFLDEMRIAVHDDMKIKSDRMTFHRNIQRYNRQTA